MSEFVLAFFTTMGRSEVSGSPLWCSAGSVLLWPIRGGQERSIRRATPSHNVRCLISSPEFSLALFSSGLKFIARLPADALRRRRRFPPKYEPELRHSCIASKIHSG